MYDKLTYEEALELFYSTSQLLVVRGNKKQTQVELNHNLAKLVLLSAIEKAKKYDLLAKEE